MTGIDDAALLAVVAIGSALGASALPRASWPRRCPAAAILLWQALGLASGLAAVGTLIGLALPSSRGGLVFSVLRAAGLLGTGDVFGVAGLFGLSRADGGPLVVFVIRLACLAAGLALLVLLCWVLLASSFAALQARRRQRALLTLLAHGDPKVPGALVVDYPSAAAYCLPWLRSRSRIVVSVGALELLGPSVNAQRMVSCHLGAGASLAAVLDGHSVDTTMGFTPLAGLVMATRPGSIDPGLVLWLQQHASLHVDQLSHTLEFESGLAGLTD